MKACVFTLGCKQNEVESASLMRGLLERGYEVTSELGYADLYILNTCAVTAEAERKSRQAVARMRRYNPAARVIVCGCASQNAPQAFCKEGVTLVTGTADKGKILNAIDESGVILGEESGFCELPFPVRTGTRAFLRVQDGCNRFCSYCLIPYLRGRSRSRSLASIIKEAESSTAKEIVLTGIDLSSYRDGDCDLSGLVRALGGFPARFRLGSLEAGVVTDGLLRAMAEAGNFVPHFHLSAQSGSTKVLREMNRRYTREEYLSVCRNIYAVFPNAAITTDLIVGFPTETEQDFEETLSLVDEAGFSRVHAFPFSARAGTNAAKLKDLPAAVKRERMARLTETADAAAARYLNGFLGKTVRVLFEDDGGYSENYLRVYADGAKEGELYDVRLIEPYRDGARGVLCEN